MGKKENIRRATAEEIKRMLAAGESKTNWEAVDARPQSEVERLADEEEGPLPEGWEDTIVLGIPEPKQDVHIRLDPAVLRWFKAQGPGYQTRINEVLRSFVRARQRAGAK